MVKKKYKVNKYGYGGISITDSLNNQVGNLLTPTGNAITPSITTKDIKPGFASKKTGGFDPWSMAASVATAIDSTAGNAIAGGRSTKVGNVLSKIPGLGIASGLINRAFGSQINKEAVANFEAQNKAQANTQFDASTTDDLLAQSDFNLLGDIKTSDIGKDGWFNHDASNTANRLRAERELANNAIVNNFAFTGSNVDAENDLLAMANAAAYGGPLTMRNSGVMSPFGNRFDIGGGIHIKKESRGKFTEAANRAGMGVQEYARHILANKDDYSGLLVKRANFARNFGGNKKADGGFLNTNGNNWTNNIIEVGNGNTHENNPYGGVPMGVDPEGTPNLVEQGERVWSATDYVFSNRLKVPKSIRSKYKLRDGITFSNAVDKLTKESKEKPNDPISKRGDNAILSELAMAQEELRMKEEMKKNNRQYKYGGTLGNVFGGQGDSPNILVTPPFNYGTNVINYNKDVNPNPLYAEGSDYMKKYNYIYDNWNTPYVQNWIDNNYIPYVTEYNKSRGYKDPFTVTREQYRIGAHDNKVGGMHEGTMRFELPPELIKPSISPELSTSVSVREPDMPSITPKAANPTVIRNASNTKEESLELPRYKTWMRYAPAIGAGIGTLTDAFGLTNKPDYGDANAILEATSNSNYTPIEPTFIGDYVPYLPTDKNYLANRLNEQAAASRAAVANQSAGNRATAIAGMIPIQYNAQLGLANAYRQANEENWKKRMTSAEFNRGTNQYNADAIMRAAMANQSAEAAAKDYKLKGLMAAADIRNRERTATNAAKANNINVLLESLSGIGRENVARNQMNWGLEHGIWGPIEDIPTNTYRKKKEGKKNKGQ